ncbi:MAG: SpoIIE family protein phosphatase [Planctomycetota bacterium]
MACLEYQSGKSPRRVELTSSEILIGRHEDCQLSLDSEAVSRRHARVFRGAAGFFVEDLGSRNGTRVNGRPISGSVALESGDVIEICDLELRFSEGRELQVTMVPGALPEAAILSTLDASIATGRRGPRAEPALRAVLDVSRQIGKRLERDELLPRVLDSLFELYPRVDHGVILLQSPASGSLEPAAVKSRRPSETGLVISRTVVQRAMEEKQAILSADASSDACFESSLSLAKMPIRSLMCVPLMSQADEALGVIELHSEEGSGIFTQECLDVLLCVSGTVAIALENGTLHAEALARNRIEQELEDAREIQQSFLPSRLPQLARYSFFSHYSSAESVGGDYYGFTMLPDGRLAIGIGDVSGKGLPAALVMARLSGDVRSSLMQTGEPARALEAIHQALSESGVESRFVTMVLMVLDPSRHRVELANAGHPRPLLRHADGRVEELAGERVGIPLGISARPDLQARTMLLELEPGAAMLVYTDGLSEAADQDGCMFGEERIRQSLSLAAGSARDIGERLVGELTEFTGPCPQRDDTTVLCFKRD